MSCFYLKIPELIHLFGAHQGSDGRIHTYSNEPH